MSRDDWAVVADKIITVGAVVLLVLMVVGWIA